MSYQGIDRAACQKRPLRGLTGPVEYRDVLIVDVHTKWGFWDRIRILFRGRTDTLHE